MSVASENGDDRISNPTRCERCRRPLNEHGLAIIDGTRWHICPTDSGYAVSETAVPFATSEVRP